jgi:hypothetical protein
MAALSAPGVRASSNTRNTDSPVSLGTLSFSVVALFSQVVVNLAVLFSRKKKGLNHAGVCKKM